MYDHTYGTDAVRLVEKQVGLVLLLERHDFGQLGDRALHAVDALDANQDLAVGPVRLGLAVDDGLAQFALQVGHVVVLEDADLGAAQAAWESTYSMKRNATRLVTDSPG